MLDKLQSTKLWITFLALVLVLFVRHFGIPVTEDQIYALVSLVTGYNLAQAIGKDRRLLDRPLPPGA